MLEREQNRKAAISVGVRPAAQSSNPCKARRYPSRARRSGESIWTCSSSGIFSKVEAGIVRLLDRWVLGNIQRIIREPHCANLMHSDLDFSYAKGPWEEFSHSLAPG